MKSNFLKTVIRNLWKNLGYNSLNIAGLAIGIAAAALIFLWVQDELTFDHMFNKRDVVYRVYENQVNNGVISTVQVTPGPMAQAVREDITGVKNATRITAGLTRALFTVGDKSFYQKGTYVDSSFFSMFNLNFIKGNPRTAFQGLHSLVITDKVAKNFFGAEEPIGKVIKMDNEVLYTVTGVMEDHRGNSSFQFDWLARFELILSKFEWMNRWDANGVVTCVELYEDANPDLVNQQLEQFLRSKDPSINTKCFLFPMTQWRLYDHFVNGVQGGGGKIKYVKLFAAIALIILVIACINFMNLATARSEQRAKEVGVRKTLGAGKRILILQFLGESMVLSFIAVALAIGLIYLSLPSFNSLVGKSLSVQLLDPWHASGFTIVWLTCGLLAGSYPAFYLSSFNPVHVLKGLKATAFSGANFIRRGLVTAQFTVSIVLMIATIVTYQQIQYAKGRDLGYSIRQLLYMDVHGTMNKHFNTIKNQLLATGAVENAALSINPAIYLGWYSSDNYSWPGKNPSENILITTEGVTTEYISTVGMQVIAGRDFSSEAKNEAGNIIINETLAAMVSDESVIGQSISADGKTLRIIGVVRDFVYGDMYSKSPAPVILTCDPVDYNYLTIRLKTTSDLPGALSTIEKIIKTHNPEFPFEYTFMDEEFDKLFKMELLIERLAGAFAVLAVFISCLGLFGLAAYTAQRRSREIGIRKILGASLMGVTSLMTSDFLKLMMVAFVIAFPSAWLIMDNWLLSYEYRTPIYWWVFFMVGCATTVITLITISFQTLKVARVNPTAVLRN